MKNPLCLMSDRADLLRLEDVYHALQNIGRKLGLHRFWYGDRDVCAGIGISKGMNLSVLSDQGQNRSCRIGEKQSERNHPV